MTRRFKTALAIDLFVLLGLIGLAMADEPSYGRVSLLEGDAFILRAGENE